MVYSLLLYCNTVCWYTVYSLLLCIRLFHKIAPIQEFKALQKFFYQNLLKGLQKKYCEILTTICRTLHSFLRITFFHLQVFGKIEIMSLSFAGFSQKIHLPNKNLYTVSNIYILFRYGSSIYSYQRNDIFSLHDVK